MTMTIEARTNTATEVAPLGGSSTSPDVRPTHSLRLGSRLDVRPYFIGTYLRLMWLGTSILLGVTLIAAIANLPQVWAFTLMPTAGMLVMAIVVTFDYVTSDADARPQMLTRRTRK
jgi:hypothetical protein